MNKRAFTVGSLIQGNTITQVNSEIPQPTLTKVSRVQPAKLVIMQNGNRFEISPVKGKLLDVAISQGKTIQYKCRKGTCGQCAVKIIEATPLSEPNELEKKKLTKEIANGFRLACQAEII